MLPIITIYRSKDGNVMEPQTSAPNTSQTNQSSEVAYMPGSWPKDFFGFYKYSKQAIQLNWQALLGLILADLAISIVINFVPQEAVRQLLNFIVGIVFNLAISWTTLQSVRGQVVPFEKAVSFSFIRPATALNLFLQTFVTLVLLLFSLGALIIPFFFVYPRLVLAPFFLIDQQLNPIESIKSSWRVTKGYAGKIWLAMLAGIAMALPMITIIGIPFSLYWLFMYSAVFAIIYELLKDETGLVAS